VMQLAPFRTLAGAAATALAKEGEQLLAFLARDAADRDIRIVEED
jgi:hypothetical protein